MLPGLSGSLLSHFFAERLLAIEFSGRLGEETCATAQQRLTDWQRKNAETLGPASGIRTVWDCAIRPLADVLGYTVTDRPLNPLDGRISSLLTAAHTRVGFLLGHWNDSLDALWRHAVHTGLHFHCRWCICSNGHEIRIVDGRHTYSRAHLHLDVERAIGDRRTFAVFWGLLRADAFQETDGQLSLFEQIVRESAKHSAGVSRSLRTSVLQAVGDLLGGLLDARFKKHRRAAEDRGAARGEGAPASPVPRAAAARGARGATRAGARSHARLPRMGPVLSHARLPRMGPVGAPRVIKDSDLAAGFGESLTLVYRILFLLFAEARGLVPAWHPIYRERYTIESLRELAELPSCPRGLWETLQAIARLAHRGCHAGTLVVPAFNGRLFSPARAPLAETCAVDDEVARSALMALSTAPSARGTTRARIDYRDLGVEQLGAVYETVLDYQPAFAEPPGVSDSPTPLRRAKPAFVARLRRGGDQRKTSGSFYTPLSVTEYLVRRALHPLVARAQPHDILNLRVVDPAMGSGAFLVAACRYLASAYEAALVREGSREEHEIDERERAGFRRLIAQRCIFGVDLNPTAVQLARLSLWLATLAADRPLTFLDHHLAVGDSLIGASPADLARRPPPGIGRARGRQRPFNATLFADEDLEPDLRQVLSERSWIEATPDDSASVVRDKERRLGRLQARGAALTRWKTLADLWCACWFWRGPDPPPTPAVFSALSDEIVRGHTTLPPKTADTLLARARAIATEDRFFHWSLEFPEVYFSADGHPLPNAGFDAVIGNPPWDMLRADSGSEAARDEAKSRNPLLKRFVRDSLVYRLQKEGHTNRYQLFLERAMTLTRQGGRIGLVLPSGLATDHTSASLRRRLIEACDVDAIVGMENRRAVFPIHRSVRFVLLTATPGRATRQIRCRFGEHDPAVLDTIPDEGDRFPDPSYPVVLTPGFISRVSGDHFTVPEIRTPLDLSIVERITSRFPELSSMDGWQVRFGRELNATDDRRYFRPPAEDGNGLPVLEGKHIGPFTVNLEQARHWIPRQTAARLLDRASTFDRSRLAYRDVASATNRLSLIAAVLPAGVVTTHSLFCLKTPLPAKDQAFLCGVLNSFVANYLIRLTLTTHLGSTTVEKLRVPKLPRDSPLFLRIAGIASTLVRSPSEEASAELQGLAARAYEMTEGEYRHVLSTFPLVPEAERAAAFNAFCRVSSRIHNRL